MSNVTESMKSSHYAVVSAIHAAIEFEGQYKVRSWLSTSGFDFSVIQVWYPETPYGINVTVYGDEVIKNTRVDIVATFVNTQMVVSATEAVKMFKLVNRTLKKLGIDTSDTLHSVEFVDDREAAERLFYSYAYSPEYIPLGHASEVQSVYLMIAGTQLLYDRGTVEINDYMADGVTPYGLRLLDEEGRLYAVVEVLYDAWVDRYPVSIAPYIHEQAYNLLRDIFCIMERTGLKLTMA